MQEHRHITRWQINWQAKIKLEDAENFANCFIKDINLKGIQISLGLRLPKDTFLNLSICLAENYTLDIEVWVVWHKSIMEINTYGLYFSKIKDQDKEKIYRCVYTHCPKQIYKQYRQDLKEEGCEIMQSQSFEDKRIFGRFSARLSLRFLDLKSNREGQGETLDIGAKGIGLVVNEELVPHTPLELWLEIPDKGEPLYTRGKVVWSNMIDLNKCRLGINLEKADLMGLSRVLRTI